MVTRPALGWPTIWIPMEPHVCTLHNHKGETEWLQEKMYIFLQLIVFRYWQGFKKGPLIILLLSLNSMEQSTQVLKGQLMHETIKESKTESWKKGTGTYLNNIKMDWQ